MSNKIIWSSKTVSSFNNLMIGEFFSLLDDGNNLYIKANDSDAMYNAVSVTENDNAIIGVNTRVEKHGSVTIDLTGVNK